MFYRTSDGHPLAHNPFNSIVAPRPIGWISTRSEMGDNLAPYSFFNAVAYTPPQVIFASTGVKPDRDGTKDSVSQLREAGVFCANLVTYALKDQMNASCANYPAGTDEFAECGIEKAECETIDCPRVAAAPASLECRVVQVIKLLGEGNYLVHGEVTGIHIADDCLKDGLYSPPDRLVRLGNRGDYAAVSETFEMLRPKL
ncbi:MULTISPECIES: flavin reductase family protein [Thioclava]|uniref:Flavin reductase n=1 Tax=Thioclava nitratireducens TaxID=1915078 RepID=A0ABM6IE36_9RHOB|nr:MULTISPECIES: flavin reductase family protein [Thioclava]AQS47001.1 flavin reductase [Thioclava nitratireducens]OWY00955.1 flavin reductase [Thioclava sp. IC9]OWY01139.1 flavin reductase [Thioclava sp. F1Mire-8]OWY11801.1 flavin reductase [Thioclava sp. F34-6]OWY15807.1 flavin reductase [Thioclava sp. JM3]